MILFRTSGVGQKFSVPACAGTLAAAAFVLTLSGCDRGPQTIEETRELQPSERKPALDVASEERFERALRAFSMPSSGGSGAAAAPDNTASTTSGDAAEGPRLAWDAPEGWEEVEGSMMRDVNFVFGPNQEGECYLSRMPGSGGGLAPNVNRWRAQMGLEAQTEEEIQALPTKPLFGQPATFVQLDGSFKGMGAAEAQENYRMLGLIVSTPNGAVFVKMTGPKDLVEANAKKFETFAQSLRIEGTN